MIKKPSRKDFTEEGANKRFFWWTNPDYKWYIEGELRGSDDKLLVICEKLFNQTNESEMTTFLLGEIIHYGTLDIYLVKECSANDGYTRLGFVQPMQVGEEFENVWHIQRRDDEQSEEIKGAIIYRKDELPLTRYKNETTASLIRLGKQRRISILAIAVFLFGLMTLLNIIYMIYAENRILNFHEDIQSRLLFRAQAVMIDKPQVAKFMMEIRSLIDPDLISKLR